MGTSLRLPSLTSQLVARAASGAEEAEAAEEADAAAADPAASKSARMSDVSPAEPPRETSGLGRWGESPIALPPPPDRPDPPDPPPPSGGGFLASPPEKRRGATRAPASDGAAIFIDLKSGCGRCSGGCGWGGERDRLGPSGPGRAEGQERFILEARRGQRKKNIMKGRSENVGLGEKRRGVGWGGVGCWACAGYVCEKGKGGPTEGKEREARHEPNGERVFGFFPANRTATTWLLDPPVAKKKNPDQRDPERTSY